MHTFKIIETPSDTKFAGVYLPETLNPKSYTLNPRLLTSLSFALRSLPFKDLYSLHRASYWHKLLKSLAVNPGLLTLLRFPLTTGGAYLPKNSTHFIKASHSLLTS